MTAPWPFDPLPLFGFDVIMADPPWLFETYSEAGWGKAPQGQYDCMPTEEIAALPVGMLAKRHCWLWLWGTFSMRVGVAEHVLERWGFHYVTGGTWVKRTRSGKLPMGTGYVLRGNAEPFIIGRMGEPRVRSRSILNVFEAPPGRHSEKPVRAYEIAEKLFGPAFRLDLFSRRTRPGWTAWGNQAGLLDDPNAKVPKRVPAPRLLAPPDPAQFRLFEAAA